MCLDGLAGIRGRAAWFGGDSPSLWVLRVGSAVPVPVLCFGAVVGSMLGLDGMLHRASVQIGGVRAP
jgi:LytS/YehU family sensor histidine kinase